MSELEFISGVGLEASDVLVDALTGRFEGFEARGAFHGMNADAFGGTVIHGGDAGSNPINTKKRLPNLGGGSPFPSPGRIAFIFLDNNCCQFPNSSWCRIDVTGLSGQRCDDLPQLI